MNSLLTRWALVVLLALPSSLLAADPAPTDQAALEAQFEKTLSGSVFVGSFTRTDRDGKTLAEERYTISKVTKVKGDTWLFQVRIQYGGKDATVPLPLDVKWAGDTPVITLTDLNVPGFGKFTSRVLVYRDHYAGFWAGADHGGHLFGRIERAPAESK